MPVESRFAREHAPADHSLNQFPVESSTRPVIAWLLVCCALVFAMVVLGGVTRLTHSGLSIVEWQPLVGTIPPLSQEDWDELFEKYRLTPEYREVNRGMDLDGFKDIFWLEYCHRLLGRLIGLAFLAPFAYFLVRGRLPLQLKWRLAGIFVLGGLQGALGWYMVASGLVNEPRVSQHRLAAHLALAFAIYGAMWWTALELLFSRVPFERAAPAPLRRLAWTTTALIALMVVTGGLVAGIRAGRAYNTFPLMNGHLVPPEILMIEPWWENFFSNMATVQFDHRLVAWTLAAVVPALWLKVMKSAVPARARGFAHLLLAALTAQIALGITTLLLVVPVPLAAAHQAGALVVLTAALGLNHALGPSTAVAPAASPQPHSPP